MNSMDLNLSQTRPAPACGGLWAFRELHAFLPVLRASLGVSLLLFLFISCRTIPEIPDAVMEESEYIPLEPGALVYVFADVQGSRPILDLIQIREMNEKQSKQMLDRTRSAAAALYPPESGRRFQLTAWGDYPSFRAGMAFGMSKNWKKRHSATGGLPYWYSAKDRLSVALNAKQAFVSAPVNDVPDEPFLRTPGLEAPEGFLEFRRGALISCWLEDPAVLINQIFEKMRLPLQLPAERIFVSLFLAADRPESGVIVTTGETGDRQYDAMIRIQVSGATQARALVTLFTLARSFIAAGMVQEDGPAALAALLFANPPVQDGRNLNIKIDALTGKDIALLFSFFPVY